MPQISWMINSFLKKHNKLFFKSSKNVGKSYSIFSMLITDHEVKYAGRVLNLNLYIVLFHFIVSYFYEENFNYFKGKLMTVTFFEGLLSFCH